MIVVFAAMRVDVRSFQQGNNLTAGHDAATCVAVQQCFPELWLSPPGFDLSLDKFSPIDAIRDVVAITGQIRQLSRVSTISESQPQLVRLCCVGNVVPSLGIDDGYRGSGG